MIDYLVFNRSWEKGGLSAAGCAFSNIEITKYFAIQSILNITALQICIDGIPVKECPKRRHDG
jgi:hypothetical protein